jgi:hypothetical protein
VVDWRPHKKTEEKKLGKLLKILKNLHNLSNSIWIKDKQHTFQMKSYVDDLKNLRNQILKLLSS